MLTMSVGGKLDDPLERSLQKHTAIPLQPTAESYDLT